MSPNSQKSLKENEGKVWIVWLISLGNLLQNYQSEPALTQNRLKVHTIVSRVQNWNKWGVHWYLKQS